MQMMRGARFTTRIKMPMTPAIEMLCSLAKSTTSDPWEASYSVCRTLRYSFWHPSRSSPDTMR